ncbi:hypothetical protein BJY01DRAFT_48327 [Aspergillus pseudoustus]|uniref:NACHT domain-containing protein n=1 Tax=Aspergillus pseudoustus TaxID=1810923 RepID=A0ABR4JCX9_9EURO
MADPFSVAASIAGLVTLAEEVFQLVCKFGRQVKDAQSDIKRLSTEIRSLSVLLYELSLLAKSFEDEGLDTFFRLHHVNSCRQTVQDVKLRLEKALGGLKGQRWQATATRLKWPYTGKEVKKLLDEISTHKKTMNLALAADTMKTMLQALSKQEDIADGLADVQHTLSDIQTRIVVDKHRQDVLDFFMRYNPQTYYEMSLRLRHPLTGLWLTEGAPFKSWLDSQNGKLWLSGIPGAGKTVLAGSMIEECLKRTWYAGSTKATCFFFCDYKEPKSQDMSNILSTLASQLARQSSEAFQILDAYYEELHPEKGLSRFPDSLRLSHILSQMADEFDQVLMIVDGLDECGSNSPVTEDLVVLSENAVSISMALLSRVEHHIRVALEGVFGHIEIAAQNADVQLYVRAELKERIQKRKLRIRRQTLEEEIINALISGAQGM